MSMLPRQFCTFLELKRRKKWMAEFCPKQWLAAIKSRLREKQKRRQSMLKKISPQGAGDNHFAFRGWVPEFISMKATAHLRRKYEEAVIDIKSAKASLGIVLRRLGRILTIFALCCAIGLQWIALQSLAWTTMLIDYSKRAPLCQAIAQTFDGAHPCSLCHVVATGKASEKKSDMQAPVPKIDMICAPFPTSIVRTFIPFEY